MNFSSRVTTLAFAACLGVSAGFAAAPSATTRPAPPPTPRSFYATPFENHPDAAALTEMGRALFFDARLSGSGRLACASCHDPAHAYGPPNGLSVQLGGLDMKTPGVRAVPSLKYQQDTPAFHEHFNDTDGDDSVDLGPTGGRGWDGRAESAHAQAAVPLLSPFEMANPSAAAVIAHLRGSPSAERFRATFGPHALDDDAIAWHGVLWSLEVFQQSPAEFYPYTSKYDAFLRRQVALSPDEARGLRLFNDVQKGNCAQCHLSDIKQGAFPQFTDRGLIAIGVPRNPAIPANANPRYFDLGLCGPLRTDFRDRPEYCGLFKTPSLRNVAQRTSFFHNGVYHRLDDAVRFYAQRDTRPERIYGRDATGRLKVPDDLPARYRANLNTDPPFGQKRGGVAPLSSAEIADIVAFLRTLTDGYEPPRRKDR